MQNLREEACVARRLEGRLRMGACYGHLSWTRSHADRRCCLGVHLCSAIVAGWHWSWYLTDNVWVGHDAVFI